jgi:hypothetical protein
VDPKTATTEEVYKVGSLLISPEPNPPICVTLFVYKQMPPFCSRFVIDLTIIFFSEKKLFKQKIFLGIIDYMRRCSNADVGIRLNIPKACAENGLFCRSAFVDLDPH